MHFFVHCPGSSPSTTVIVSNESKSRTCIHTTGDCFDLRAEDVRALDIPEGSHVHFDTRQTKAAYSLVTRPALFYIFTKHFSLSLTFIPWGIRRPIESQENAV